MFGDQWPDHADLIDPATHIPESKYPLIHKAVMDACDALDGVKDGIIEDPTRCHFDPGTLLCKGADTSACLTAPQVEAARKIYGGAHNPRTGQQIFPGMSPGSEMGWRPLAGGPEPFQIPVEYFKYVLFKNPNWDWKTLNFDSDVALADKTDPGRLNSINPDLKAFFAHGGKLIQYHGWNDQLIAPLNSVNYYKSVQDKLGNTSGNYRLFMVPGMGHCGGGDGANTFDMVTVIEQWVEQNKAPDQIIAERRAGGTVERTHPLCPYPETAHYKGSGNPDDAANFMCQAP
jgi:feruloyl esterase